MLRSSEIITLSSIPGFNQTDQRDARTKQSISKSFSLKRVNQPEICTKHIALKFIHNLNHNYALYKLNLTKQKMSQLRLITEWFQMRETSS